MNKDNYAPVGKEIRFVDTDYKTKFMIKDGGYITITLDNGEEMVHRCRYHGEYHVDIGRSLYHIHEFAERMAQNGNTYEPCPEPEVVHGYMITDRIPVGDKVFVLAHDPDAVEKYVTWQGYKDKSRGYDFGHYWNDRSEAWTDLFRRADSERTGKPYSHIERIKQSRGKGEAR